MQSVISLNYDGNNLNFLKFLSNRQSTSKSDNKIIKITNFSSLNEIEVFISEVRIRTLLFQHFPSLLNLQLTTNNGFDLKNFIQLRSHEFSEKERFLLTIESSDCRQMIIYWKNYRKENFYRLDLFDKVPKIVKEFVFDCIYEIIESEEGSVTSRNTNDISLSTLNSTVWPNLLYKAVDKGKLEIVKELLKFSFDVNEEFSTQGEKPGEWESLWIIDFAFMDKRFDIMLELLKANSKYPEKYRLMKEEEKPKEIEDFLQISKNLFAAIKDKEDKQKEIVEILDKNPNLRYFFNDRNVSAATLAVRNKKTEIYKLFLERNLCFGIHEIVANTNDKSFLDTIRILNSENSQHFPGHHIILLMSKSVISHSNLHISERFKLVKETFEFLDKIPEVKPVLQILAIDKKTKFHFDFTKTSIAHMDLSYPDTIKVTSKGTFVTQTRGLFQFKDHHIYIGAKNLLDKEMKNSNLATVAHECYHFAFHLVFMNERLPFVVNDEDNKTKFMKILDECEKIKDQEIIIKEVYNYKGLDEENTRIKRARELAVRVPHMLTQYFENEDKIKKLKETFKNLFDYHYDVVMPEIENSVTVFEDLTNKKIEIKFNELTEPIKAAICHSIIQFQGEKIQFKEIADEEIFERMTSKHIRDIVYRKELIIGKKPATLEEIYVERNFIDFDFDGKITELSLKTGELEFTNEAKQNLKDTNSIINEVEESKVFLLADHAGAGKSTTMKKLCLETKTKLKNFYVSYIDLKKHLKVYDDFKKEIKNSNRETKIILEILIETLKPSDDFEALIFKKLFSSGQLALFYDGLDEIAPKYEELFIKLIKDIKQLTKTQQYIATRPQHIEILKTKLERRAYKLLPLDEAKTKEFIKTFAKTQNIDENLLAKIKRITENPNFVDNPLMLKIIVDLHMAGELVTTKFNRFSLYDALVYSKREILAGEKGMQANLDTTIETDISIWRVHQVYALKTIFPKEKFEDFLKNTNEEENFIEFDKFEIFELWIDEKENWTAEIVARCGFLTVNHWNSENENPEFVHRTFAEYFVTKFIIDLLKKALKQKSRKFDLTMKFTAFVVNEFCRTLYYDEGIFGFISDYLELNDMQNIKVGEEFSKFLLKEEIKKFLFDILSHDKWYKRQKISKIVITLLKLPEMKNLNFIKHLTLVENDHSKMFEIIFKNQNSALECVELFKIFINENFPNGHKVIGYGKNIKQLDCDHITKNFIGIEDQLESKNDAKVDEVKAIENIRIIYQMLYLIKNANDIAVVDIQQFLLNLSDQFSLLILRSHLMIEIFFEIGEKYFHNSKEDFKEIYSKFIEGIFSDISILMNFNENFQFLNNLNKFFELSNNFFNYDPIFVYEMSEKFEIILQSSKLNCFQILFILCENFQSICQAIEILKKKFGKIWLKHTGYSLIGAEIIHLDENKAVDFCKLLGLKIPLLHLECFYKNHLYSIFKTAIMYDNRSLIENFFETYEKSKQLNDTLYSAFFKVLWIDEKYEKRNLKSFQALISLTKKEFKNFKEENFLRDFNTSQSHPLFQAINSENDEKVKNFKRYFTSDEIFKIIFFHFKTFSFLEKPEKLKDFFNEVFSDDLNGKLLEKFEVTKDVLFHVIKNYNANFTEIGFYFVNLISRIEMKNLLNDLEIFLQNHFHFILSCAFRCRSITDEIFVVLKKNFVEEKLKISEWISKGFDKIGFFIPDNIDDKQVLAPCTSNIEYFLIKTKEFFNSNQELMQKFLLYDYELKHPLVISIYYDIDCLRKLYFENFSTKEILRILISNIDSISRFFDINLCRKFFNENFLTTEEQKQELKEFFEVLNNDDEKILVKIIDEKLKNLVKDNFSPLEAKVANSTSFLNFLLELSETFDVSLFKAFCLKNSENLSSEAKELLSLSNNTKNFFDFAFRNDAKVLNEILDIKFYGKISIFSLKSFAFNVLYLKLMRQMMSYRPNVIEEWIRNFLLIDCEPNQIHPLILAIHKKFISLINIYKMFLDVEIFKIFFQHLHEIRFISFPHEKIFKFYFTMIFDVNFGDQNQGEFLYVENIENENFVVKLSNISQIFFYFLSMSYYIDRTKLLNDLESFLNNQLNFLLSFAFRCQSIINKIFDIFEKHFENEKENVAKWIKNGFDSTDIFDPNGIHNKQIIAVCQSNIEYFWTKVKEFFNSDRELMQNVLLNDYEENHPIVIGIYYEIDFIKEIYFDLFEVNEVLESLISNLKSISKFFDKKSFENFFKENFLSSEIKRINFIVYLAENSIFHLIQSAKKQMIDETKSNNIENFYTLLHDLALEACNI